MSSVRSLHSHPTPARHTMWNVYCNFLLPICIWKLIKPNHLYHGGRPQPSPVYIINNALLKSIFSWNRFSLSLIAVFGTLVDLYLCSGYFCTSCGQIGTRLNPRLRACAAGSNRANKTTVFDSKDIGGRFQLKANFTVCMWPVIRHCWL